MKDLLTLCGGLETLEVLYHAHFEVAKMVRGEVDILAVVRCCAAVYDEWGGYRRSSTLQLDEYTVDDDVDVLLALERWELHAVYQIESWHASALGRHVWDSCRFRQVEIPDIRCVTSGHVWPFVSMEGRLIRLGVVLTDLARPRKPNQKGHHWALIRYLIV